MTNFKNVIKQPKISKKCNIYLNKPKIDHYPTSPKITTMNNMTEIMMMIMIKIILTNMIMITMTVIKITMKPVMMPNQTAATVETIQLTTATTTTLIMTITMIIITIVTMIIEEVFDRFLEYYL